MAYVVIIGAGLTGISTAYHLEKNGFFDYQLFEKDQTSGGLCRSVTQDNFTFDYTGHLLHASDPYFRELIETIVGMENLNIINRESFIYSHGTYTRYPFQSNLYGLPPEVIAQCIEGFAKRPFSRRAPRSFHEWVVRTFGIGIAQNFFFPFQSKIFAYNIKKVSPTWMGRFVPNTTLTQLIEGSLTDRGTAAIGYNANFVYPKQGGIQFWINKLANQLRNTIQTNYQAHQIDLHNNQVQFSNGHAASFKVLINTAPLDQFLYALRGPHSIDPLRKASEKLLCNSVINFNVGIAREKLSTKHWIYFPETQFPFYRIGFPHNFASSSVPAGCSSLYGEFSYLKKPKKPLATLVNDAYNTTQKLLGIDDSQIITKKVISIPHAYVIYDFWREKNLPRLLNRLHELNIHSVGRYGGWKYSSMQEAVLDGKNTATAILQKMRTQ